MRAFRSRRQSPEFRLGLVTEFGQGGQLKRYELLTEQLN